MNELNPSARKVNALNPSDEMYLEKQIQMEYVEFLDDEHEGGKYHAKTKQMIDEKNRRLIVNINDLRNKNPFRTECLLDDSFGELAIFQKALKEYVSSIDPTYSKEVEEFYLGFEGNFGNKHVTPRILSSQHLGSMICVEGIVTKCSLAKLKIIRSVHYCPTTRKFLERKYSDITSVDEFPSSTAYPTKDDHGNLLETEFGLSLFKDHQTLTIQEMPEKAPPGQLPRSVDIICDNDLVDACKPGDRVRVIGSYRCLPGKYGGFTSGIFRTVVIANSIIPMTSEVHQRITRADMHVFRKISRRRDVFELLSRSLAPSIHGHDYVKKAILCLLVGGCEKVLPNGTRLRGDINVLLIGDPGVAKSQLLRFVLQSAPRAIPTTGRGSSGVGLTAAVTTDPETGERRLEAGAMVLADRGVVCIDEFDKMSDMDRTAIHEVMEQGKVTISKAGIHARLNARCSVLAAANPVYGKYNQYKTPMENIGLQDSLLSRFDLLFVLLDIVDTEDDRMIADHVVRMHRYRNPLEQDGDVLPMGSGVDFITMEEEKSKGNRNGVEADDEEDEEAERYKIFEKFNALLHAGSRSHRDQILSIPFIKKYVHMCKNLQPALSEEAAEVMAEEYARLRSQETVHADLARTQPITVRTLETLIRLATARAKVRFSRTVNVDDAKMAVELVQYAMFRKVLDKREKKKRQRNDDDDDDVNFVDDVETAEKDDGGEKGEKGQGGGEEDQQKRKRRRSSQVDEFEAVGSQEEPPMSLTQMREQSRILRERKMAEAQGAVSEERLKAFREAIVKIFMDARELSLPLADVLEAINARSDRFSQAEIDACFELLSEENRIMLSERTVFLI